MTDLTFRFDDVRDVGFFLFAAGWIVVVFANSGVITGSFMIILGAPSYCDCASATPRT